MPDRERFVAVITPLLAQVTVRGTTKARLYGEMVDLLWDQSMPATLGLEQLWNDVLAETGVALLCAYRIDNFDARLHRGVLHQITACHSELIPVEDYDRFERAVTRAYEDVFGATDGPELRRHFVAGYDSRTRMPGSQAALFALDQIAPGVAESVIDRARHHYRHAS